MTIPDSEKRLLNYGAVLPDLAGLPIRVSREKAAKLVTLFYFEISSRTLERWPLAWRQLNGKAHCETAELFEVAEAMLAEAPPVMGGQKAAARQRPIQIEKHPDAGRRHSRSSTVVNEC